MPASSGLSLRMGKMGPPENVGIVERLFGPAFAPEKYSVLFQRRELALRQSKLDWDEIWLRLETVVRKLKHSLACANGKDNWVRYRRIEDPDHKIAILLKGEERSF